MRACEKTVLYVVHAVGVYSVYGVSLEHTSGGDMLVQFLSSSCQNTFQNRVLLVGQNILTFGRCCSKRSQLCRSHTVFPWAVVIQDMSCALNACGMELSRVRHSCVFTTSARSEHLKMRNMCVHHTCILGSVAQNLPCLKHFKIETSE